jgi:hypothetical protein
MDCSKCKSTHTVKRGKYNNKKGDYQIWWCKDCRSNSFEFLTAFVPPIVAIPSLPPMPKSDDIVTGIQPPVVAIENTCKQLLVPVSKYLEPKDTQGQAQLEELRKAGLAL